MNKYDDIINLPHYESKTRIKMSIEARSAQFAPFSALTGYSTKIKEAERITDVKKELNDEQYSIMNYKLQMINRHIKEKPLITVTVFIKDKFKEGGSYKSITNNIRKIDEVNKKIIFIDETKIDFYDIIEINDESIKND